MRKYQSPQSRRCCAGLLASQPPGKHCVMKTLDKILSICEPQVRNASGTWGLSEVVMCSFPGFCTLSNHNKSLDLKPSWTFCFSWQPWKPWLVPKLKGLSLMLIDLGSYMMRAHIISWLSYQLFLTSQEMQCLAFHSHFHYTLDKLDSSFPHVGIFIFVSKWMTLGQQVCTVGVRTA